MRSSPGPVVRINALERVAATPWRFDFFFALRWIESQHPEKPRLGTARRPADEPVRLGQSADLSFAPSALHAVVPATALSKARIEVRFFGLFGPNGPLPHHLTEYARQRANHGRASSRVAVFGKLNPPAYKAVEGATVRAFCKLRGNPYVELEHWLAQIVQNPDSDWHRVIKHYQLDVSALAKDLTAALDRLPRGATSISDIAENIADAIERGWVYGSLMFGDSAVRSGYVLLGMLKTKHLRNALFAISRQFEKHQGR
jgi:hypothetical protein